MLMDGNGHGDGRGGVGQRKGQASRQAGRQASETYAQGPRVDGAEARVELRAEERLEVEAAVLVVDHEAVGLVWLGGEGRGMCGGL